MNINVPGSYLISSTLPNTLLCSVPTLGKYLKMVQYKRIKVAINLEKHGPKSHFDQLLPVI